ncbi:piggyBac transposable element-derived protein 4 [Folsomia candida]|uniref:piggyBac transposable element-derived protein 4 n=1 Tax=Folsomia candida TaxID=158441 RepID=UPI000B90A457|nr:piggyBac transposable element-derived protein 4 [Folsomia candida]
MSGILVSNQGTVEAIDVADNWEPEWMRNDEMEEGNDPEEYLQFEEITSDDEEPVASRIDGIEWEGDSEYFFPETPDFLDPVTFVSDEDISPASTPLFILQKIVTPDIVDEIITQTNLYADQKAIPNWKNVGVPELWRFFGLNMLTGVVQKPSLKDYWTRDPLTATPFFNEVMSRNRFEQILRGLHFVDLEEPTLDTNDRFHKMGTILPNILKNFRKLVNPGEFLTLDEELMPYKGALSFKQYNPKKRGRFGVKSFFLMDCQHRFVLDILPYQGKSTRISNPSWIKMYGFGGAAVLTMLEKGYLGKYHRLVVDNYFQSPVLAKTLLEKKTFVLGTVRKDRKFMPKFIDHVTSRPSRLKKGEVETFSDGDLLLERWMDRREVLMLNTFIHHRMEDCESQNPRNAQVKPASVLVYNKSMGALDDMDKIIRPYQALRKTLKWYRKFAFHLFDICVYNSWVVYCHMNSRRSTGYKQYLSNLIKEIMSANVTIRSTKGRPVSLPHQPSFNSLRHFSSTLRNNAGKKVRGNCHLCWKTMNKLRKATSFRCEACGVWLCIDGENSCHKKYHITGAANSQSLQRPQFENLNSQNVGLSPS